MPSKYSIMITHHDVLLYHMLLLRDSHWDQPNSPRFAPFHLVKEHDNDLLLFFLLSSPHVHNDCHCGNHALCTQMRILLHTATKKLFHTQQQEQKNNYRIL